MKVFDSAPELPLKPPRRRLQIAVISGIVVLSLAGIGALSYLYQQRGAELAKAQRDLSAAEGQLATLKLQLKDSSAALDAAGRNVDSCSSKLATVDSKVSAFAKQAATCERLRHTLNIRG